MSARLRERREALKAPTIAWKELAAVSRRTTFVCAVILGAAVCASAGTAAAGARGRSAMDIDLRRLAADPPFSFVYGGKSSGELLGSWRRSFSTRELDSASLEHTVSYADAETGLTLRCTAVEYRDFPVVEWTVWFHNEGGADTPTLEQIQGLDLRVPCGKSDEVVLHHHVGSPCTPTDYMPMATPLPAGGRLPIATTGGRSSNSVLPYFNLQSGDRGLILAIGWPGQWSAVFSREDDGTIAVRAGQELTHLRLRAGERIRTPLIVVMKWSGDRLDAQNLWRRFMLTHNMPRPDGKPLGPYFAGCSSHQFGEMIHANEANQKEFIDRYLEEGLRIDYWWMDAGWYVNRTGWPDTGTWEVDRGRFPNGLRAITDHAHAKGVKCLLWFEPERVAPGTWLYENHPEWLIGRDGEQKVLNLGNKDAWRWLVDHVDKILREEGIDLYRHDFNIDPLGLWRACDAPDRQGMTENAYVVGFLAYWDELRRRHPGMLIDTCASGGRRNDIETLRRSVPLHRSDFIIDPEAQQQHTYGIAFWIPFYGAGVNGTDEYTFRSQMCPWNTGCWDVRRRDLDYGFLRRMYRQRRSVAHYYMGDYYPLTPYSTANDVWIAWQFHRPDIGEGMVQAFRRRESSYEAARFRLKGLEPDAAYVVRDLDSRRGRSYTGRELMEVGLRMEIARRPGAALLVYKKRR
ncbi:MAG: alpha-galactosidase [Armatimonadota bacterium]